MRNSFVIGSEIRSSNITWSIANLVHDLSNIYTKLSFQYTIIGIVFTAFSFESMLNHYACFAIDNWNTKEKHIKPRQKKLKIIFDELHIAEYFNSNEFELISECIGIRDSLAHGKTELIDLKEINITDLRNVLSFSHFNKYIFHDKITQKNLKKYIDCVKELESLIENCNPTFNQYPLSLSGTTCT